ncbi:hypothetical protein LCGC14_1401000 [marine sediment metagenome]|uniref:Uncharacterized protein n=1 Tax=marine sediment metagenome TaxID=412755 RepID=A0A0F9KI18_9ZZZZ
MSKPNDAGRALVRLAEAVRAYLDSDMIVAAEIARELRQALTDAERVVRTRSGNY